MKDIMGLMKQAQAMQARMQDMQAELDNIEVVGQSGGGLVQVTLTAKGAMRGVSIDASLLRADEKEIEHTHDRHEGKDHADEITCRGSAGSRGASLQESRHDRELPVACSSSKCLTQDLRRCQSTVQGR